MSRKRHIKQPKPNRVPMMMFIVSLCIACAYMAAPHIRRIIW